MFWFDKNKRKKMEFIQNYVPTSKAQLLQVAMYFNKGDIGKAQEMFDFYAKNLDLPDFDPIAPSFVEQMKGGFSDFYTWLKENQSDLVHGYQFIQGIIKNRGELPVASSQEPLPPINE